MADPAKLPVIAFTMGDPAGVGPEGVIKTLAREQVYRLCRPLVIGDAACMQQATEIAGIPLLVRGIREASEARFKHGVVDVMDLHNVRPGSVTVGEPGAEAARAGLQCLRQAADMALSRVVHGIVAAPVGKETLRPLGMPLATQAEAIGALTRGGRWAVMLLCGPLRLSLCTQCVPIRRALDELDKSRVLTVLRLTHSALQPMGIARPRLALGGINPTADGEEPTEEEQRVLVPAAESARQEGIDVRGPLPAPSAISQVAEGRFDAAVVMYCDQAHLAARLFRLRMGPSAAAPPAVAALLGLGTGVALPDEGPDYESAGRGIASADSMILAAEIASRLATRR